MENLSQCSFCIYRQQHTRTSPGPKRRKKLKFPRRQSAEFFCLKNLFKSFWDFTVNKWQRKYSTIRWKKRQMSSSGEKIFFISSEFSCEYMLDVKWKFFRSTYFSSFVSNIYQIYVRSLQALNQHILECSFRVSFPIECICK